MKCNVRLKLVNIYPLNLK